MARLTMAQVIGLVRSLLPDATAFTELTDDQIQTFLDYYRLYERDQLTGAGEIPSNTWQSNKRYWEDGLALTNDASQVLSPVEASNLSGFWTFTEPQNAVYAAGWAHDPYAAAAEILTVQAARVPTGGIRKWSADGTSIEYEQGARDTYMALASQYATKSPRFGLAKSAELVRGDLNAY